jgi:hypothetical protein
VKKDVLIIVIIGCFLLIQPLGAQTWTVAKRLTWTSDNSWHPAITLGSNNHIHMVWYDNTPGNPEVFYKKSTNGGTNWTTKRLTWNSGESEVPAIAVDSGNHIHVVYSDNTPGNKEIFYKRSTNGGVSWTIRRLTWSSGHSNDPTIAIDSGNHIHVVYSDDTPGSPEIYYRRSTNGGGTWSVRRLTWTSAPSHTPAITADSSNHIHVVWKEYKHGVPEIYYKRSTDGGATWTTERLTWSSGLTDFPAITVDSSNHIHMVWQDSTPGNFEIYYRRSTNGGDTWGSVRRLTWTSGLSNSPEIAVDSSNHIHVVWSDGTPGAIDIYYKRSTNGGVTWTTKRLTWSSLPSISPSIDTDSSNNIHLLWQEYTPGNYEIFYKKGIQ